MTLETLAIIGAFITAVSGTVVALKTRKKIQAEGAKVISDAAIALVEPLRKQIEGMELEMSHCKAELRMVHIELDNLRRENEMFRAGIELLMHQLKSNGLSPIWTPKKMEKKTDE